MMRAAARTACFVTLIIVAAHAFADDIPVSPRPQVRLDRLINIEWSLGPDFPQGLQDSDGGVLESTLISTCGFCSGGLPEDNRRKPGRYPRGFLTKTWGLDLLASASDWQPLPDFPGEARQGVMSAIADRSLFVWGGFSYSKPFCYQDGFCLHKDAAQRWTWNPLPPLPWKTTSGGLAAIDRKIYLCAGADYDGETGFFTEHDRDRRHPRLGAQLAVYDLQRPDLGWQPLPECPGTPRFVCAFQHVAGRLFLIGGATGDMVKDGQRYGYCTVVDNWSFDPAKNQWTRLRDLPVSSGNFPKSSQLAFRDRYIMLPGGHQYPYVANPDGSLRPAYGTASRKRPESGLHNDVFVYDIQTDLFGTANPLPIDNNLPMSVIHDDRLFLIGGETGGGEIDGRYFGHHPDLLLIGKLTLNPSMP